MKKLILLFACLFTLHVAVQADNDKPIQVNQLPQQAQQFIKQHFASKPIAMAKVETDLFYKSYDVIFTNGNKVEFDKKGQWTEVNCKYDAVPLKIIPTAILKYVTANYPKTKITKIERDSKDYEVKLSSGIELTFDTKFNLIDIDN